LLLGLLVKFGYQLPLGEESLHLSHYIHLNRRAHLCLYTTFFLRQFANRTVSVPELGVQNFASTEQGRTSTDCPEWLVILLTTLVSLDLLFVMLHGLEVHF